MTTTTDIVNRALQSIGTRTTVASLSEQSNEAIQANLILSPARDELLRMAPWNCGRTYNLLNLITAAPGTPENPSVGPATWRKGLPPPPWAYEYQYPTDCLKALFVVPQFTTGFASGVPITTAVTGGSPAFWMGPPQRFQVGVDQFFSISSATPATGGSGYTVNDAITLAIPPSTSSGLGGAPGQLIVTAIGAGGSVTSVAIAAVSGLKGAGSYFVPQTSPIAQGSTTGSGTGATFNCTFNSGADDQRVILTNQEGAILCYVHIIQTPDVMDPQFIEAWVSVLAARLVYALMGDKPLANIKLAEANAMIAEARKADGNEALTVNDVTPDWIRTRGIYYPTWEVTPNVQYDWGPLLTMY